jgi:hypothetical protein
MAKTLYLVKANDKVISFCSCDRTEIGAPAQRDCPWCGCGWLCVCPVCNRAFTFARAEEVDLSWDELACRDLESKSLRKLTKSDIQEWVSAMQILLKGIKLGFEYVYIDGFFIPVHAQNVKFEGWHAHHELDVIPQFLAIIQPAVLDESLGAEAYWRSRQIARNE